MGVQESILPGVSLKKGSNIMIYGPTFAGKAMFTRTMFKKFVKAGYCGIYVLTRESAEQFIDWFGEEYDSNTVKIIDCVTKSMTGDAKDTEAIKRETVMNLTGISAKINKFLEEFWRKGNRNIILVFDSLSTLLMYLNLQTVFRFLHILTGRVKMTGAIAFYIVEEGMHDEKTIVTLKQLFNGMIEFKEENGKKFVRFVSPFTKTDWLEIHVDEGGVIIT